MHIANNSTNTPYIVYLSGVGGKADQAIEFPVVPDQDENSTLNLAATSLSGLPVSFTNTSGSPVVWQDSTTITFSSTGTVGIIASQPGNADWNAALDVVNTFNVTEAGPQPDLAVLGDYTGDGRSDIVVYDTLTGNWFIRGAHEPVYEISNIKFEIAPTAQWGGPGYVPVPGDYTGDGVNDLAVYGTADGLWYIAALDGTTIVTGEQWSGPGFILVVGDYDGDGVYDMAVYDLFTGNWFIRGANEEARSSKLKGLSSKLKGERSQLKAQR